MGLGVGLGLGLAPVLEPGLDRLREGLGAALARVRLRPTEIALEWSEHDGRGAALLRGLGLMLTAKDAYMMLGA